MSSTTQTYVAPAYPPVNGAGPSPLPRVAPARRRSPAMVSLGVVLVVVGSLAGWRYVASTSGNAHPYLAVYRAVPVGGQITAADLQTVTITSARGLTPIPAAQENQVIGKYATTALVPGTLLAAGELASSNLVGPNQALIGLELGSAQRPNRPLRPGDHVLLVQVPASNSTASSSDSTSTATMPTLTATVVDVGTPDNDSNVVVDVTIPQDDISVVAFYANENRVAAVLVAGG